MCEDEVHSRSGGLVYGDAAQGNSAGVAHAGKASSAASLSNAQVAEMETTLQQLQDGREHRGMAQALTTPSRESLDGLLALLFG